MSHKLNLIGRTFYRLSVISEYGILNHSLAWNCACVCGNNSIVRGTALIQGRVKSCGCLHTETMAEKAKHSMSSLPIYRVWQNMKDRCSNPNNISYEDYGGRGIAVCKEWEVFEVFYEHVKEGYSPLLTLDRIRVNGNYEPGNVRWATRKEQAANKRNNVFVEVDGVSKMIIDWSIISGVSTATIYYRLYFYGWTAKEAVFTPKRGSLRNSKGTKLKLCNYAR